MTNSSDLDEMSPNMADIGQFEGNLGDSMFFARLDYREVYNLYLEYRVGIGLAGD